MGNDKKINIAIAGGPCTGKSTLAADIFARLKREGLDYDLIGEESRKLRRELGDFRSPFERVYIWRQQEREELRSTAENGFITDSCLYMNYVKAKYFAREKRDSLAVRELFRMCMELEDQNRYHLIIIAKNPEEIPYKKDSARSSDRESALKNHDSIKSFLEHFCSEKLLFINGDLDQRVAQSMEKILAMH